MRQTRFKQAKMLKSLFQQIVWVLEKELRYALRDTDVLIYSVLVPLLIYPGTLIAASEVMLWQMSEAQRNLRVHITDPQRLPAHLYSVLAHVEGIKLTQSGNPSHDLEIGKLDAIVTGQEKQDRYDFVTYVGSKKGILAANKLNEALVSAQTAARLQAYKTYRVPPRMLQVCLIKEKRLVPFTATQAKVENYAPVGILAAVILGFLQVGLTSGVSAVCVLAEERQKKTFETTLTLPVPRYVIMAGKWLAAATLALFSGMINIVAMSASTAVVCLQAQLMQKQDLISAFLFLLTADAWTYTLAALSILLCAGLSSAVCLLFVSTCKSFRDAQAIVTYPMLFIVTFPILSFVPGIEQMPAMNFMPFTNLLLCLKHPQGNYLSLSAAVLESAAITALSLWFAGKMYFSEKSITSYSGGKAREPLPARK